MSSRLGLTNKSAPAGQKKTVGADEDMFLQAFEDTPRLEIDTLKDLESEFNSTVAIISTVSADWDKRVDAIKRFRSLLNCGIADSDDFFPTLRTLEIPFQNNISDLRSQVVRETCITLAFLSCRLQQKFSRMAEMLFPSLVKLIPNSAKIMSTSATVAIRFIIQSTHNSRLIPIIRYQLSNSKSKEIHRALCEFVERIVHTWPANTLERHLNDLKEVIRLGICDSDEQARIYARKAFNGFADLFRDQAEQLYNSLDLQRQRMLNSENNLTSMSNHGSTNSVNNNNNHNSMSSSSYQQQVSRKPQRVPAVSHQQPSSLALGSVENLYGFTSRLQKISQSRVATASSAMNPPQSPYSQTVINESRRVAAANARSTSAIDVAAQRRAKARANYLSNMYNRPVAPSRISPPGQYAHQTAASTNAQNNHVSHQPTSLIMTSPSSTVAAVANVLSSPGVTVRSSRCRISQSQPGSRSTSPSSRYSYITNSGHRRRSGIPVSTSRSTSPAKGSLRDSSESNLGGDNTQQDGAASVLSAQKATQYLKSLINGTNNNANTNNNGSTEAAIKFLTKLIEHQPPSVVCGLLDDIMPSLITAYDNPEASVRKEAVFAMVAIYGKVGGEKMESHLSNLSFSKRKLLFVYIDKKNAPRPSAPVQERSDNS